MDLDIQPHALDRDRADAIYEALERRCAAHHRASARHGAVVLRAFCICGQPDTGPGGRACELLAALARGGDGAAWLETARALDRMLDGAP